MRIILLILLLAGSAQAAVSHLVNGCRIFTLDGIPVSAFPGDICVFFPDGSFVSASVSSLRQFSKTDEVEWEIGGNFHHQLELDEMQEHVLALGNVIRDGVRYDSFNVISRKGKIVSTVTAAELFAQENIGLKITPTSSFIRERTGAVKEVGHFNSMYQIPGLRPELSLPSFMKKGNFVVNALNDGVFVLSADLRKVLHRFRISQSFDHQVHDVQVRPAGDFLYFNNRGADGGNLNRYSAVQILSADNKLLFSYSSEPKEFFYSQSCGGVQDLGDGTLVFSDVFNATYFYSIPEKKLHKAVTATHRNVDRPWNSPTQRVKAYDLREFLQARKIR